MTAPRLAAELPPHVLWLDPGRTTGWATIHCDETEYSCDAGETDFQGIGSLIDDFCRHYGDTALVGYESYLGRGGTPKYAHEVIGVARYLANRSGTRIAEAPAANRVIVTLPMIQALGCYSRGEQHANDAGRHLVAWLLREGHWTRFPALHDVFTSLL